MKGTTITFYADGQHLQMYNTLSREAQKSIKGKIRAFFKERVVEEFVNKESG